MIPIQAAAPDLRALLRQPQLSVVSAEPDFDLREIAQIVTGSVMADGRADLEELLGRLLLEVEAGAEVARKTLDLIGHTRSSASLVALGDWVIDASSPTTTAFFRELADHEVLPRLGVHAVRLLGCNSAATPRGRHTLAKLREILGIEVWGADQLLCAYHWEAGGFAERWASMLIRAGEPGTEPLDELGRGGAELARPALATPYPRVLDVDMLPAVALGSSPIPRRIADISQAGQILQLVRRREGAAMPGLLAAPVFELALPAAELGAYHVAHALLEGEFLRFYPDGMTSPGIVFPVEDAAALRRIAASLLPDPYAPYGSPVTR